MSRALSDFKKETGHNYLVVDFIEYRDWLEKKYEELIEYEDIASGSLDHLP